VRGLTDVNKRPEGSGVTKRSPNPEEGRTPFPAKTRWPTLFAVPLAVAIALALHWFSAKKEPPGETRLYASFLTGLLAAGIAAATLQPVWSGLRAWMRTACPLVAAAVLFLTGWELTTAGFRLLPLPYFPSPASVLQSLVNDRAVLFESTWHSLILLLSGYALGVTVGLFS
jgi:NitT/TauT family transport system permease protein